MNTKVYRYKLKAEKTEDFQHSVSKIYSPENLVDFLRPLYADDMNIREISIALYLNRNNEVLGYSELSTGGVAGTVMDPKLLFSTALGIASCCGICLSHNHPSGNLAASIPDKTITKKMVEAGKVLEIDIIDHVIITENHFLSFSQRGWL